METLGQRVHLGLRERLEILATQVLRVRQVRRARLELRTEQRVLLERQEARGLLVTRDRLGLLVLRELQGLLMVPRVEQDLRV